MTKTLVRQSLYRILVTAQGLCCYNTVQHTVDVCVAMPQRRLLLTSSCKYTSAVGRTIFAWYKKIIHRWRTRWPISVARHTHLWPPTSHCLALVRSNAAVASIVLESIMGSTIYRRRAFCHQRRLLTADDSRAFDKVWIQTVRVYYRRLKTLQCQNTELDHHAWQKERLALNQCGVSIAFGSDYSMTRLN